jgi:alpha-L-rhamnosidase
MRDVTVSQLRAEYRAGRALGIGEAAPRLSWIVATAAPGWRQTAYAVELDGVSTGRVEDDRSVFVPWPGAPLRSRRQAVVRVRVWGADGSVSPWSDPLAIEAGLLSPDDWVATWVTPAARDPLDRSAPAHFLRRAFTLVTPAGARIERARLYVTSAGIHRLYLNGAVVGDAVLAPGWSAYRTRLRYDTHDVTDLLTVGENVLGAIVADGWWRGYLSWTMARNVYGDRLGLLAQLEITFSDGSRRTVSSDLAWRASTGPILAADLYNGETYDARLELDGWAEPGYDDAGWSTVEGFTPAVGALEPSPGPPVRCTQELAVREVLTRPSGRTILDFGQNLVGWVRFTVAGDAGTTITLRHAEVLDAGELGTRPLRHARATDRYTLRGGGPETWEPAFTFHGFRYVEVEGWPGAVGPSAFTAVVVHSDIERTGTFSCSNDLLNRLHENVVWSMRGNFVSIPSDCPQRDERLGWTGDIQVFGRTACYLYDVAGFLAGWLADLRDEQTADGAVPFVVPNPFAVAPIPSPFGGAAVATAAWGDAATFVPWTLYQRYGDTGVLARQFDSMRAWVDCVRDRAGAGRLWLEGFQFGDWLDPDAPPEAPRRSKTDAHLVASAYFARSAQIVSDAAAVLGRDHLATEYGALAAEVRAAFRDEYVTPNGRVSAESATAYALALMFDLIEDPAGRIHAAEQLARLAVRNRYRISTGFVGTPLVLPALTAAGDTVTAYRLLTETSCPSWLYPVTMGATTVWERWDSMLPDGSINPGEMTSFNHYALGSVADWMHQTIGGLAPAEPGYRRLRVAPVPGRGVTSAAATLRTPYGTAACAWSVDGVVVSLAVEVPPNASAEVVRPGLAEDLDRPLAVGPGRHAWQYTVSPAVAARWSDEAPPA